MDDSHEVKVAYSWTDPDNRDGAFVKLQCSVCEYDENVKVPYKAQIEAVRLAHQGAHLRPDADPKRKRRRKQKSEQRIEFEKRLGAGILSAFVVAVLVLIIVDSMGEEAAKAPSGKYTRIQCEVIRFEALGDSPDADEALLEYDLHC